jgi:excisionase family DNA binding protein
MAGAVKALDDDDLRLLTVREFSGRTGLPVWRVYELLRNGEAPPHIRIGKTVRFPIRGVRQWMERQAQ